MKIKYVHAEEILDSRGNPTIQTITTLYDGSIGVSATPSGASTGSYEAVELRDNDNTRYNGQGVLNAIENVNTLINPALSGLDAQDHGMIDKVMLELDGTANKANLGANAILSVSLSVARAQAVSEKKPLYEYLSKFNPDFKGIYTMPIPQMNVINGGKHANWATDIQEYMIMPLKAGSICNAVRTNVEVYHCLKELIKKKGYAVTVGDEGGFAPAVESNEEPLILLTEALSNAKYKSGEDIFFAIDPAASEFYEDGHYRLNRENKVATSSELSDFYKNLHRKYPIISMEDTFAEDDWSAFEKFTAEVGSKIQIVGDDLYVTNKTRLQKGITNKATNCILIKLNQIGTLTETIDTVLIAKNSGMGCVVSHRSGETEDTFIADFAVAMGVGQIKTGAPARSERTSKYNRLMHIERELGNKAVYATFPRY